MSTPAEHASNQRSEGNESTPGEALVAGGLATAIAIGCLVPPVIHFVSGPLGPAIGGFFAGQRVRGFRAVAIVAFCTAVGFALATYVTLSLLTSFAEPANPMQGANAEDWTARLASPSMRAGIAMGAGGWALLLGGLGAGLGAAFRSKAEEGQ